jgi:GT2 family glycosyltransferase
VLCILVTTYNRRSVTKRFLSNLVFELSESSVDADIFIVDDGSTDGTPEMISRDYPVVNLIHGNGDLYWASSVNLAIEAIGERLKNYWGILHLNDDILLNRGSLDALLSIDRKKKAIVGGAVLTQRGEIESSGSVLGKICKPRMRKLIPDGEVQVCDVLPGQILLIPTEIFFALGGFDKSLKYSFIDLEFTLRASRSGFKVLLAPHPLATTEAKHDYFKETSSKRGTLRELVNEILLHPKGPHFRDSVCYLKKVSPYLWWLWIIPFYRGFFVAVLMSWITKFRRKGTA